MSYLSEELARQHIRDMRQQSAYSAIVRRHYAAQRWSRLAAWSAHRSAMAQRSALAQRGHREPQALAQLTR